MTESCLFQDLLQGLSSTETGAKATARTDTGWREDCWGSHMAASPRERLQHLPGERQVQGWGHVGRWKAIILTLTL